jgi:hypothetical protein
MRAAVNAVDKVAGIIKKAHDEVGFTALRTEARHLTPRAQFL